MKKNNSGISMITLIITIICIILFLGISYRIGSRYISKSKEEERTALKSVLSAAVERRQNDKYVGVGGQELFYTGYHVPAEEFEKLSINFEAKEYSYDPGLWFALDAECAKDLGIVKADEYLVSKLENQDDEDKYVAIADYSTGEVQLIKYKDVEENLFDDIVNGGGSSCSHPSITVVSCLEPSVCKECGKIIAMAPGHEFINDLGATCTENKECTRCGYVAEFAKGHEYSTELSHNDEGHYNLCINGCGTIGNFEEHDKAYGQGTDWEHTVSCRNEDCDWIDMAEDCTRQIKAKDLISHIEYCEFCKREIETVHDVIKYRHIDKNNHMKYCETCKTDLGLEEHIDINTPYGECDKCHGVYDIEKAPILLNLTMENITDGASDKYWAKTGDKIRIVLESSMLLSNAPTIKVQDIVIKDEDIKGEQPNSLRWIAEIDTSDYAFSEGKMNISVTDIRSMWAINGADVYETTDGNIITYDSVLPEYIYITK